MPFKNPFTVNPYSLNSLENKNENIPTNSEALREHLRSERALEAVQLAKSLEMSYRFNIAHAESAKPNYIRNAIKNDQIKDHKILAFWTISSSTSSIELLTKHAKG
ncbi:hypothetical protein MHBO_005174 [Bonamia ostreae]|uniref:Uncharacterized protein n=1 Tax=Bonamia ostreae TaxID=126728 RepID=A0ABV2AV97_9EUKA